MPVAPTYPGVYIEEIPSGVRTITGVSTSVALFVGRAAQGPLGKPVLCLSYNDFLRTFTADARYGELPRSVKLFFDNGGTQCYVLRIAKGAAASSVTLQNEAGDSALVLTAKNAGLVGDSVRAAVTYSGQQPEATFNIEIFRWVTDATGQQTKKDAELWQNLTMDAQSRRYAPDFLTQSSKLVDAKLPGDITPGAGFSQSMRPIAFTATPADFLTTWTAALNGGSWFQISVDGGGFRDVDLSVMPALTKLTVVELKAELAGNITQAINDRLPAGTSVIATFIDGPLLGALTTALLRVTSAKGDVFIQPWSNAAKDLATRLMLGTAQGGLEVSRFAAFRPAPNGITFMAQNQADLFHFATAAQSSINMVLVDGKSTGVSLLTTVGTDPMIKDGAGSASKNGNFDGIREKLGLLVTKFNALAPSANIPWRAELWGLRLAFLATSGGDNNLPVLSTAGGTDLGPDFKPNVRYATLGAGGKGLQSPGQVGFDGTKPGSLEYDGAYQSADKEIDLFNLLVLPADVDAHDADRNELWGPASVFCAGKRALLLMDAPDGWKSRDDAVNPGTGVNTLRTGLVKANSALFYPSVLVNDGGTTVPVGPSGAIAGLMARIDASRGVWKAPAGMEADLRGIAGLTQRFSDGENGVLNPRGINTLRVFPFGTVNWGARTMDGDDDFASEWKYLPVRRLALFLEESLYQGTKWAVFEPNDEPLWSQLRLNLGAFMHGLFRQGAFQGKTPREAYFVKCDRETTTQDDINHGVVNILVGFAPLKPAEFVIIQLQQMAGQLQA